jgi:hypothetical protein
MCKTELDDDIVLVPQYLGDLAGYPSAIGGRKSNVSKPEISQDPGGKSPTSS